LAHPSYNDVQQIRYELKAAGYEHWLHNNLFTWQWWILLVATIFPWIIWGYLVKKKDRLHVFAFAMFIGIVSSILDVIGADILLWGYPTKLFFMVPPLFPADLTIIPVVFSLAYHYGKSWKRYTVYSIIISFLFAYVIEPFFAWANMYQKYNFHHWLSLIGFFLVALIGRWLIERILPLRN